jgi:hypothetical protein
MLLGLARKSCARASYGTSMSEPDDDYEWPPKGYPWIELITASLFVLFIGGFLIWWAWELIDLLL